MQPTTEQDNAVDAFGTGRTVVVQAGAGTGKTTTLKLIARSTPRPGSFLAFNKVIAAEAQQAMPMNVQATTMHSLAFRTAGQALAAGERLDQPRLSSAKLARILGIDGALAVQVSPTVRRLLQPSYLAGLVMKSVTRFCQSDRAEPSPLDVPRVPALDLPDSAGVRSWRNNRELAKWLLPCMERAWADLIDPRGRLRFSHDVYLKAAQLAEVEMPGEFLLVDEAQDLNPVMMAWVSQQQAAGKQLVYVGDTQQQIYEWRGAVDAMAAAEGNGAEVTYLTQSFRFGPEIAYVANAILAELGAALRLVGTPSIRSRVAPQGRPDAVLCRGNAHAVHSVLALNRAGLMPFLVGGADEIVRFTHAAVQLMIGKPTNHPELACFEHWREVQEYVDADPQGDELRMLVNMLDDYGPEIVLEALSGLAGERDADVVVSTGHKAKGREWSSVRLAGDFASPGSNDNEVPPAEWRLLYVAVTRAQHELDITWATPIRDLLTARPKELHASAGTLVPTD